MRRKTSRRLRIIVVFMVASIVALLTGSAMALATGGGHGGPPTTGAEVCFVNQFDHVDQEHGAGSVSHTYSVHGVNVTVTFSWTADKHLTASVSGGTFVRLYMKAGDHTFGPFTGAGPYSVYEDNPSHHSDNGLALSHMNFCLLASPTTGSLQITKSVTGEPPAGWTYTQFSVTVTGPGGYSWSGNFSSSGVINLSNLAPGTYTISEATPTPAWAWQTTVEGGSTASVSVGAQAQKTITNNGVTTTTTAAPGSLRITKTITGDNPAGLDFADFYVTVTGPNGYSWHGNFGTAGEILLTGLAPGDYTIDEDDPAYPFSASGEGSVSVVSSQQAGATITNTGRTTTTVVPAGSLRITKTIAGDNPNELTCADFYVTVTGPNNYSWYGPFVENGGVYEIVLNGLAPGSYNIDEDDPVYPFSATGEGPVTVISNQQTGTTIINTGVTTTTAPPVGSLRITKSIAGDQPPTSVWSYEDFTVVVTGPAPGFNVVFNGSFNSSGEIVIDGLAPGTYTVTEEAPGYPWVITGNGTVEVVADQQALKSITNTGSTTTTLATVTSNSTGTTNGTATTLSNTVTTQRTTRTTQRNTGTTVLGFSNTSSTVMGWVAQPDNIQTGGGGMAGGFRGAWIALGLAGMMLVAVVAVSVVGVRHGTL